MTARRTYKKRHRVKKKKSILKSFYFWLIVFFVFVMSGLFCLSVFWEKIQIKEIRISGNQAVEAEAIKKIVLENITWKLFFRETKSILFIRKNKLKREILNFLPRIEDVKINRDFPDTLVIEIREREPYAVFCDRECFLIDKNGVIFERGEGRSGDKPIIRLFEGSNDVSLGDTVIDKGFFDILSGIEKNLRDDFQINITGVATDGVKRLNIKTNEGWEAYFNLEGDVSLQVLKLKLLLKEEITPEDRKELEYIDLRFSRVYYK